ncbi:hypothetical protein A8G98_005332, partial [Escherichia coli]|nr:hypothetical protein [Escherichia coli]
GANALRTSTTADDFVLFATIHHQRISVSVIHIGYVRLSIEEDEDRYIVRHYTLDRKELPNEWNMSNFYNGEYGLKPAMNGAGIA